jgi:hypothetical protein
MLIVLPVFMAGQGVIVSSGIYMKMTGGALVLHDNWTNNGSYADTNSIIILNGTATQYIGGNGSSEFDDMTIINSSGVRATGDFTVEGTLNLSSVNPSAFLGTLDMGSNTLTMDSSATTIGAGDVTGIVRRTTFISNKLFSFGNQYTTLAFRAGGTYPSQIKVKIKIGTVPSWKSTAIKRTYALIQTGGNNCSSSITMHYLHSELNGNEETHLVIWGDGTPGPPPGVNEFGRSDIDYVDNWIAITNVDLGTFPSSFGQLENTLAVSELANYTWNGSQSSDWTILENWTPNGMPSLLSNVIIPDTATTIHLAVVPLSAEINSMSLESNAVINAVSDAELKVFGNGGAWINNNGIFNPNTSNVIFTNSNPTIAGTTKFYNVTIPDTVILWLTSGSIMRIAGTVSNKGIWHTVSGGPTTVDYDGGDQNIVIPNPATARYYNLILSGNGIKTMPDSAMAVLGDFSMSGTATTAPGHDLTTTGNFTLGPGTSFTTGALSHTVGGNFSDSGSFVATGSTFTFNGAQAETIGGTSATTFDNLTSDNPVDVTLTSNALTTVAGALTVNSGKKFSVAPGKELTVSGTISNSGGTSGFVLHSDTTGTASLLHNTDNVPGTSERYISGETEAWHFLSSPVAAQNISGSWLPSGTYGNGTGYDLYVWNEPTSCWIYKLDTTSAIDWHTVHPGSSFTPGRGYLYSVQAANPTKSFSGTLNNGSLTYALTAGSSDISLIGFNLVGNPYPSSIDWQASSGWTRTDLVSSGGGCDMWIWNPAASNYGVCNSVSGSGTNEVTRFIAPMQGYFVHASADGSMSLDNSIRVHTGSGNWFKGSESDPHMLNVIIQSESDKSFDEVRLLFDYNADKAGARKLFSHVATAPSLFMPSAGDFYSVRYLTNTTENPTVAVAFKPGKDGNYKLTCNFDAGKFESVVLEDRQKHYLRDMKMGNTYDFEASKTDDANRFVLHFGPDNNASYDQLPARIYTDGSQLIIDLSLIGPETETLVYDMLGRLLLKETLPGLTMSKRSINAHSQILVVHLKNSQGSMTKKLFYNN